MEDYLTHVPCTDTLTIPAELWRLKGLTTIYTGLLLWHLYYCQKHNLKASRKALARHLNVSLPTVHTALNRLESLGYITKHLHKGEDAGWLPSTYAINDAATFDAIEASYKARG